MALTHDLKMRLKIDCIPAFTTDGLRGYFYSVTAHFGRWFRPERARTDQWQVSDDLLHGQLIKRRKRGSSNFTTMRTLWGKRKDINKLLEEHGFAPLIQTAFIEHINRTIRRGVAPLMRKTWALPSIFSCMSNGGGPTIILFVPMSLWRFLFPVCSSSVSTLPQWRPI